MSTSRGTKIWLGIGGLVVGLLVGGLIVWVRSLSGPGGERSVEKAQKAYQEGVAALEADQPKVAVQKCDEARLLATKALEELDVRRKTLRSEEEARRVADLEGEALWVKARALRDMFYAEKAAAGEKALPVLDTSTGESFRSVLRITDPQARNEAIFCQRLAAERLLQREDVLLDTLRTQVSLPNVEWPLVETLARATLDLDPKDARSLYILARIDVDQPRSGGKGPAVPVAPDKRSRDRLLAARDHLKAPGAEKIPPFRRLSLETEIAKSLRDLYRKTRKEADAEKEDRTLVGLVVDPKTSALAVAMQENQELKGLSRWDQEGIVGMHEIALARVLEDMTSAAADPTPALGILDRQLAFANTLAKQEKAPWLSEAAEAAVQAAVSIQPHFEGRVDPAWNAKLDALQDLVAKAQEQKKATAALYSTLSQILGREAIIEGKRGNKEREAKLKAAAKKWLDEGLKLTTAAGQNPADRFELLTLGAERAALENRPDEARKYLDDLRKNNSPAAVATVALLEALLLQREGKLERARQELEKVLASQVGALHLRAHLVLAPLYRTLNQPEKALDSLVYIDRIGKGFEALPEVERAWARQFFANPETVQAQLAVAHLGAARAKLARFLKASGGNLTGVGAVVRPHEDAAVGIIAKLPKKGELELATRADWSTFLAQTGRLEQARKEVAALQADHPASVDLLRLDVALRLQPAPGTKPDGKMDPAVRTEIDRRIDAFTTTNPAVEAGRLFRAQWLMRTERAAEAVAYLRDTKNFPAESPAHQQMLALAHLVAGQKKEGLDVLQHLADSPGLDALLIRLAESREEKYKRLSAALEKYEQNSLFQCWDGERALADGKPAEALERFSEALEVTAIRPLAEQGMRRALFDLIQRDPKAGRDVAKKLADDLPQEPLPLLGAAYAALVLGDVGDPADGGWPRSRSMSAALAAWEDRMNRSGGDKVAAALTRAEFYAQANNVAQARTEVERALILEPTNAGALLRAINLALAVPEPAQLDRAEQYLEALAQAKPDAASTLVATGRLAEARDKLDAARAAYEKVLAKTPEDATSNTRLIAVLDRSKQLERVPAVLDAWAKAAPEAVGPRLFRIWYLAKAGQPAAAQEAADKLVEDHGQTAEKKSAGSGKKARQEMNLEATRQLLVGGATDQAEARIAALLKEEPDLLGGLLLQGDILMKQKKFPEAVTLYQEVLKKHPGNLIAGNNAAYLLTVELEKPAEADAVVRDMRRNTHTGLLIPGDRLDPSFLDTVGLVYQKLNDPARLEEMRALFEPAVARYPDDPRLAWHLAYALVGLKENARAGELLDRADRLVASGAGRLTDAERKTVTQGVAQMRKSLP